MLVTHDRELALYADRIITLIDGKVVDDRPNQSIAQAAAEEVQPQEQEEGAHDFVIPILGKEKQEENNTKTSTEQVANELLPDQLQKAAPTEQQTVQPQKTEGTAGVCRVIVPASTCNIVPLVSSVLPLPCSIRASIRLTRS